jgi:hypothetical protein
MKLAKTDELPAIRPEDITAIVDELVPVALRYLEENPRAGEDCEVLWSILAILFGQCGDVHSRYYQNPEICAVAWSEVEKELARPQPRFSAYDTGFVVWEIFDCYREAERVLSSEQLECFRGLFRTLGEFLLANPWSLDTDSRTNPAVIHATCLAEFGWALGDERMLAASRQQVAEILACRVDENNVPSEVSASYYAHELHWLAQACEVAEHPDLLRLMAGIRRMVPMLIYEPTLELIGPDCRDQWKTPGRHTMDVLVVGLRAAAVLLDDPTSEWLCRTLFHTWIKDAKLDSAAYTPRGHALGNVRYEVGWGQADDPRLILHMALRHGRLMGSLRRWLDKDILARKPKPQEEYISSKLQLRRYRHGSDAITIGNVLEPISYATTDCALQGIELWSDDDLFWGDLYCHFITTYGSAEAFSFAVPLFSNRRNLRPDPATNRYIQGVVKYNDQLLHLIDLKCNQELVPGIVKWAGLLLMEDHNGEVIFGRDGKVLHEPITDTQENCDWFLYPCGKKRRFGVGLIMARSSGVSNRLCNYGGDWYTLGISESNESICGLEAFAVMAIGPWYGSADEYAAWLQSWQVTKNESQYLLTAPEGRCIELPIPAVV